MSPFFWIFSVMTIAGAVAAVSLRNLVHCALSLVVAFAGLAGHYLLLGAHFVGLVQVLVYIGAVAVLIVFVVLLTHTPGVEGDRRAGRWWWSGVALAGLVAGLLITAIVQSPSARQDGDAEPPAVARMGELLMSDYVLPLELVGLLLTVGLLGAVVIAVQERKAR